MNPASRIESPAQRADRLERERDDALAQLTEARRTWSRAVWAFWAVVGTNVAVLLIVGGLS
ncbi:MAG: hypothetical protein AAGI03_15550 [Pseudomonadota bacterium]